MHIGTIPFLAKFKKDVLSGKKHMTSRNRKYGNVGDTFDAFRRKFVLVDVSKVSLQTVKDEHWEDEGCESPEDFESVWVKIHPRTGFVPEQMVWLHAWLPAEKW